MSGGCDAAKRAALNIKPAFLFYQSFRLKIQLWITGSKHLSAYRQCNSWRLPKNNKPNCPNTCREWQLAQRFAFHKTRALCISCETNHVWLRHSWWVHGTEVVHE